jgi:pimeloyl-ACP methyl ester carboxylesterase
MVEGLRSLLASAEVPGPYVLVGHSSGGLLVCLYAARCPQEVAGLVLVDSAHEEQYRRAPTRSGSWCRSWRRRGCSSLKA